MKKEEVLAQIEKMTPVEGKYLMGTKAYHQLGEISRDEPDLFYAKNETKECYLGSWVTGMGFFNVCFPKETSRELTKKEIKYYNKKYVAINSNPPVKLNVG
jgi:hypothetical protein